jgi:hypothetical protein
MSLLVLVRWLKRDPFRMWVSFAGLAVLGAGFRRRRGAGRGGGGMPLRDPGCWFGESKCRMGLGRWGAVGNDEAGRCEAARCNGMQCRDNVLCVWRQSWKGMKMDGECDLTFKILATPEGTPSRNTAAFQVAFSASGRRSALAMGDAGTVLEASHWAFLGPCQAKAGAWLSPIGTLSGTVASPG